MNAQKYTIGHNIYGPYLTYRCENKAFINVTFSQHKKLKRLKVLWIYNIYFCTTVRKVELCYRLWGIQTLASLPIASLHPLLVVKEEKKEEEEEEVEDEELESGDEKKAEELLEELPEKDKLESQPDCCWEEEVEEAMEVVEEKVEEEEEEEEVRQVGWPVWDMARGILDGKLFGKIITGSWSRRSLCHK